MSDYRAPEERLLTHKQIKKFPKEIRDLAIDLVNNYGVRYRLQSDGQHVLLYSGREGDRPFKVGATRNPVATKRYLRQWLADNVPDYIENPEKEQTVEAVFKCAQGCKDAAFTSVEEINAHYAAEHPVEPEVLTNEEQARMALPETIGGLPTPTQSVEKEEEQVTTAAERHDVAEAVQRIAKASEEPEWVPYVSASGKTSPYIVKATLRGQPVYRCTFEGCEFQRVGEARGLHLHEQIHTPEGQEIRKQAQHRGGQAMKEIHDAARKRTSLKPVEVHGAREALDLLARAHGYVVVKEDEVADPMLITALRDEVARLQDELDEVNAKMALAKEAFGL